MNKYLYPIKNLKTKSYIKWWLYRYLSKNKANYILSEILEGTSFTLEDSTNKKFNLFQIIGNTTQESTTGVQLINITSQSQSSQYGFDVIVNNDKSITINGTSTASSNLYYRVAENLTLSPGNYTLSNGNNNAKANSFLFLDDDNTFPKTNVSNVTLTEDTVIKPYIRIAPGATMNKETVYPMIVKGTYTAETMPAYEAYTGGTASPSPSYPQEIKNTGDNVNLFDVQAFEAGIVSGKILNNSGVEVSDLTSEYSTYKIPVKANETIHIKGWFQRVYLYDKNETFISRTNQADSPEISTIPDYNYTSTIDGYVGFQIYKSHYNANKGLEKIEQSTKATPYSPYGCGNVNEKVQNKNLQSGNQLYQKMLDFDSTGLSEQTVNSKQCIRFSNGLYRKDRGFTCLDYNYKENTSYTIRGLFKLSSATYDTLYMRVYYKDGTYNSVNTTNSTNWQELRIVSSANKIIDSITFSYGNSGAYWYLDESSWFIGEGDITDYVPHEEQNISFPLAEGQKFYGGDYLADDGVHHVMREITINGSESGWRKNSDVEYFTTNVMADAKKNTANARLYGFCDKVKSSNGELPYNIISKANANNGIDIKQVQTYWGFTGSTVEEFKEWLAQNPIKIQYELETEVIDAYTSEQQQAWEQIKALRTYKPVTHISSEDELSANLKIQYWKEG